MSLFSYRQARDNASFPRVSGDEPQRMRAALNTSLVSFPRVSGDEPNGYS